MWIFRRSLGKCGVNKPYERSHTAVVGEQAEVIAGGQPHKRLGSQRLAGGQRLGQRTFRNEVQMAVDRNAVIININAQHHGVCLGQQIFDEAYGHIGGNNFLCWLTGLVHFGA